MDRPINETDEPITVICMEKCYRDGAVRPVGDPLTVAPGDEIPRYYEAPMTSAGQAKSEEGQVDVKEMTKTQLVDMAKRLYKAEISENQRKDEILKQLAAVQERVDPDGKLLTEDALLKGWGVMAVKKD